MCPLLITISPYESPYDVPLLLITIISPLLIPIIRCWEWCVFWWKESDKNMAMPGDGLCDLPRQSSRYEGETPMSRVVDVWYLWYIYVECLYYIVLYYTTLYCISLYYIVLYYILFCYIIFYCIILYYIVLYCIILHCIVLYCIVVYYIILYYILCIIIYIHIFTDAQPFKDWNHRTFKGGMCKVSEDHLCEQWLVESSSKFFGVPMTQVFPCLWVYSLSHLEYSIYIYNMY